jgi:hypothetical protein
MAMRYRHSPGVTLLTFFCDCHQISDPAADKLDRRANSPFSEMPA